MLKRCVILGALGAGLAMWTGCKTKEPAFGSPSVAPGVNAPYQADEIDVEEWVARFETEGREVYQMREEIVRNADIWLESTVADIGAGTGAFSKLLSEAVGPKGQVYAVDIVPEFLLHLKQRMADEGVTNVKTVLGGERSVDLPDNSVDLAFLCDVYHHFEYPRATLASLHKAIRPGGRLVLVDFKRIPDLSSEWVMEHVRAGQEVFAAEIEAAGFKQIAERSFLNDNYFLIFRRLQK